MQSAFLPAENQAVGDHATAAVRNVSSTRLLIVAAVLLAVSVPIWAARMASDSPSWRPDCYGANVCDGLTFTVVAELLAEGKTPYLEAVRREHIART
ncbi:MAG TPA: hypothetical protein VF136_17810, partial [Methylomirabilota bacterium]